MARIRTIKPEFFRHHQLFSAEQETGFPLRVTFAGLWTVADREGRFKWRPEELKLDILPYDDIEFSRVLDALATRGFVVMYECEGEKYGHIPSWHDHQVVNNREKESKLPNPSGSTVSTREARVDDASTTPLVQDQGEGKGKGREGEREKERERERNFRFCGRVIKLSNKDFETWKVAYPSLDLNSELQALDDFYHTSDSENWFRRCSASLAKKHRENQVVKNRSVSDEFI